MKTAVSSFQSTESKLGEKKTAPTPRAIAINARPFKHPCSRETLPSSHLQYLSAVLTSDCLEFSTPSVCAFSFYQENKIHGYFLQDTVVLFEQTVCNILLMAIKLLICTTDTKEKRQYLVPKALEHFPQTLYRRLLSR